MVWTCTSPHLSVFVREGDSGGVYVIEMGWVWGGEKGRTHCYHRDRDLIPCLLLNDFLSENQQSGKEEPRVSAMLEDKDRPWSGRQWASCSSGQAT